MGDVEEEGGGVEMGRLEIGVKKKLELKDLNKQETDILDSSRHKHTIPTRKIKLARDQKRCRYSTCILGKTAPVMQNTNVTTA